MKQTTTLLAEHPEVVATLRAAYDQRWTEVQPLLVNENVTNIPKMSASKELYWKQFRGGPDEALLKNMDPAKSAAGEEADHPREKAERKHRKEGKPEAAKE